MHNPQAQILSFEQIYQIVKIGAMLGIQKVRITGGEPLVRKDLPLLIEKLKTIEGLKEIALTTNGIYLSEHASTLRKAGLDRINISLDSLNPEKFQQITRGANLEPVLKGIESALAAGFSFIKINTVLLKGFNTEEIPSFAGLTKYKPINVRFIEYMPTDFNFLLYDNLFFAAEEAKTLCGSLGELESLALAPGATARIFRIKGFCGTVGFISAISQPFCSSCNKLRLTANGLLRGCLHSSQTVNLKELLDKGAQDEDLIMPIREAVALKPKSHNLHNPSGCGGDLAHTAFRLESENFSMCQIGG